MEIINKRHPEIIDPDLKRPCYMILWKRHRIYFNAEATHRYNITPGRYMQFMPDLRSWFFWQSDDKSGFAIHKTHSGTFVQDKALFLLFKKRNNAHISQRFYVKETNSEHNGNTLYEIKILNDVRQPYQFGK
jgi:hypothetical protein